MDEKGFYNATDIKTTVTNRIKSNFNDDIRCLSQIIIDGLENKLEELFYVPMKRKGAEIMITKLLELLMD